MTEVGDGQPKIGQKTDKGECRNVHRMQKLSKLIIYLKRSISNKSRKIITLGDLQSTCVQTEENRLED